MIQRQKVLGIVASVVLAAVGTGLLVTYVRSAEDRALKGEKTVGVLVVTDAIPKGTKAEALAGMVRTEQVPTKVLATGAVTDIGAIAGLVSNIELLPGEQLVAGRFAAAGASTVAVPAGSLQVTISLDPVRVLGGQVREGDSVGVLASFDDPQTTHLIVHKVPVTNVRTLGGVPVTSAATAASPEGSLMVTLAMDAGSAEKVVFAAEHGRLWLAWQPPDAAEGGTKVQTKAGVNL